mgnify:CR=1 FL=1|tara:strand:- start:436 stop:585 length:150 start_codon:yes stop_codon:yes gene_type:complete
MLKRIVQRLVRKHGVKGLLLKIGDYAVKQTKSKEDDQLWAEVKQVLDKF